MSNPICGYCDNPAELTTGEKIYPHRKDLYILKFWICRSCKAYVGCHKNSNSIPLGTLANKELRKARRKAHAHFDPIWKNSDLKRGDAYKYLAKFLDILPKHCHISWFNEKQCQKVLEFKYQTDLF